ncbi:MAG: outer membrane protein transport protein [Desulfobacterales bacterium]|nr:MAG: outer membrane protein transport protein [Desulfobacterales bacterium]
MINVGPISRSMGGVGIAAPQDAISAVFANPAAMCFGPYCPSTEVDFAGTLFMPDVSAKVSGPGVGGTISANSDDQVYAIPAFGLSVPITEGLAPPDWRFGLAAFGVSGLGVDYRDTDLDQPGFFDFPDPFPDAPLIAGEFTQLQIMRFAPSIAYQPNRWLSLGLAFHIDYSNLDLRDGSRWDYGWGAQVGLIAKPTDNISLGLNYTSPRPVDHKNVRDFDGDGSLDDLRLDSPQEVGLGIACQISNFLIEANTKWINWADADGYEDFDWDDQYVFAIGAQFEPIPKLFLRAGYNYAKNPVEENNGFDGTSFTSVQGTTLPRYFFETFRVIGFPAVVEHHLTLGIGYEFSPRFALHAGYVHGFENTIKERGTDITGQPVTLESTLEEDTFDFGLTFRF